MLAARMTRAAAVAANLMTVLVMEEKAMTGMTMVMTVVMTVAMAATEAIELGSYRD